MKEKKMQWFKDLHWDKMYISKYREVSNIRRTLVGN